MERTPRQDLRSIILWSLFSLCVCVIALALAKAAEFLLTQLLDKP